MPPHPLQSLSLQEVQLAKDIVLQEHEDELVIIREICLQEPPKKELVKFLELEHSGSLTDSSPRPSRLAAASYDVIGSDKLPYFHESVVDVEKKLRIKHEVIGKEHHAPLKL
jgi:primary-amine oxidase